MFSFSSVVGSQPPPKIELPNSESSLPSMQFKIKFDSFFFLSFFKAEEGGAKVSLINRPGVAGAVLQTALLFINSFINSSNQSVILCENIFRTS